MSTKAKNRYEMDMLNGSIWLKMLGFAFPLMFSSILQLLFNAADIIVVGQYAGDNSMGAVGSTGSLINLMTNLFVGLSVGANILAARYVGSKQDEELSKTVHTAISISIISGIFLTIIGVFGATEILKLMGTPKEVFPLAVIYLRIYFLGMTAMMVYNFGSALLRAIGDTRRPMYYLMIAGVINVGLNLIFVIVLKMDVAGVAVATVVSQVISAVLVLRCLMKEKGAIRLSLRKLQLDKDKVLKIMQIGLPAGFQGVVFSLSNVVIQSAVNYFGNIVVAGNSAAQNLEGFVYVSMNAFHQAAVSFTSQNYGARQYKRIRTIAIAGEVYVVLVGLILGNVLAYLSPYILRIYSPNPAVVDAGVLRMMVIGTTYALCGMMDVMVGMLRGIGYSVLPMIVSMLGACGLRLLWIATVFQIPKYHTREVLYWSYPVSWIITFLTHLLCFLILRKVIEKREYKE